MPRVSPEYHARRRAEIVQAARACFARQGFHAASMDDVIAEAGVSSSTVYRQFTGKDALVRAVVDDVLDELAALLADALSGTTSPRAAIARILTEAPSGASEARRKESRAIALYAWAETQRDAGLRRHLRARYRALLAAHRELAARWTAAGELPVGTDADAFALLLGALVPGSYVLRAILGEADVTSAARALLDP